MKSIKYPIIIATAYLVIYTVLISVHMEWTLRLGLFLFSLSPFPVIWMVYSVLKYGKPSKHTFDERFYEDG